MRRRALSFLPACALGATLAAAQSPGQPAAAPPAPTAPAPPIARYTVADLAFLEGSWAAEQGGAFMEKRFTSPAAGHMLGMYRRVVDGRLQTAEFLFLEEDAEGVVLRSKHYGAGWKEHEAGSPAPLRLISIEGDSCVFVRTGDAPLRSAYTRRADAMEMTLESVKDGKPRKIGITMHRIAPTAPPAGAALGGAEALAGAWAATPDHAVTEEHWMAPLGNCMVGVYRWAPQGRLRLCEFLVIEEDSPGVVTMRFKHFNPGWQEWEHADPLTLRLVRTDTGDLAFENAVHDQPKRVVYDLEGDNVKVIIETTRDGKPVTFDVDMARVPAAELR